MNELSPHDQYKTIENITFNHDCISKLIGLKEKESNGTADHNKESLVRQNLNVVREVQIRNCQECHTTGNAWNQKIFYILKVWTCKDSHHREDHISLGYKPLEYSFRKYIESISKCIEETSSKEVDNSLSQEQKEKELLKMQKKVKQKQEEVLLLLKDIVELVSVLHSRKIVLRNIQLNNIIISKNDNSLNAKIVNLSHAEAIAEDAGKSYKTDLINIGKLLLSFITQNDNFEKVFRDINRQYEYSKRLTYFDAIMMQVNWIEPYRKKLLAHLIIYLIEIDNCDETTIHDFKKHPFFWNDANIEEFLRIVSCRIDYNDKLKAKTVMKKRINGINTEMKKYDDWKDNIDANLSAYIPQDTYKKNEYKCNELIKFIRNKIAHKDDDTDNEDFIPDLSESSSNSPNRSNSPTAKKAKSGKDLKPLFKFFNARGGPLNYFLYEFPDLLHDLFIHFRRYSRHIKINPFYPECFQSELPKVVQKSSNVRFHAPVNTKSKNESLKNKSRRMELTPKMKA